MLYGNQTYKLVIASQPYNGATIYGIGISVRRDVVSLANWGFFAKANLGNDESKLLKLSVRSDRKVYLISSY